MLLDGFDVERAERVVRVHASATFVDATLERAIAQALDVIRRTGKRVDLS